LLAAYQDVEIVFVALRGWVENGYDSVHVQQLAANRTFANRGIPEGEKLTPEMC
jgi:hypothetical protein